MADVSFFNPTQELDVKRRRKLADTLAKQGQQPDSTQVISGVAVQQSPLSGLAKALQAGLGGYAEGQADKEDAKVQSRRQKMIADAIGKISTDPYAAAATLGQDPATSDSGISLATEMLKNKQAMALAQWKAANGGGDMPAAIQIANEIQKAIKAGDFQRANILAQSQKMFDKGINGFNPSGNADVISGYIPSISGIEGGKSGAKEQAKKDVDLTMNPQIEEATNRQGVVGTATGNAIGSLNDQTSQLPRLEQVAQQLSDIGKKATYTTAGRVLNAGKRELGLPVGEGAVARTEYISKVDNEILPLLRQTFGAQFTAREGDTLRSTLGDPNKSPEEKDAVLRSFIDQKKAQIGVLQQRTGQAPQLPNQAPIAPQGIDYKSKYGLQ